PAICRRIVAAQRPIFEEARTSEERTVYEVDEAAGQQLGLAGAGSADEEQRAVRFGKRELAFRGGVLSGWVTLAHHPKLAPT
ncbi:MAG TPA: hypothetical protein VHH14_02935, partial [Solirubrobacterales bacterium]|nr:hypothetical protein [Solirubrobacterales bacterium]